MTRFPDRLTDRAAATIARTVRLVNVAHQRLNTLGSQVASLTPGDWEALTLEGGWSNLSGYVPAQVRIVQNGMAQLVGHITGGTTTNGTVIAQLGAGYYSTAYAHSFTANVLAGASAVSNPVSQGSFPAGTLTGDILVPQNTYTFSTLPITLGPGGTQFSPSLADGNGGYAGQNISAQTTAINYNTVTLTLSATGQLTLTNCSAAATQLSFNESLPLVTD